MKKIRYRTVYNRKNGLNAQGTALLQIEAYMRRRKVYFSSHIYLAPNQWDEKQGMITNHPNAEALNYMLQDFVIRLEQKEIELWKNGCEVTLERLKEEMDASGGLVFQRFVQENIQSSPGKASTRKNKQSTLTLLSQFRPGVSFRGVNSHFIHSFENFLYGKGYQVNTVAKHMKHLKGFVNSAIDRGYIKLQDYPFQRYKTKRIKGKSSHLIPEEVAKLEALQLAGKSKSLTHTLEAFLFCCYTGLRYSDFVSLTARNILMTGRKPWIVFSTVKTGAEVKLPLFLLFDGKAWKMLQKYRGHWDAFFALKPNSSVNKELKRIAKLADIEKHFTFHSARHTCATLLIYNGANITTVQKLLGHRNVSTTQIYSDIMESTIIKDLKRCSKGRK